MGARAQNKQDAADVCIVPLGRISITPAQLQPISPLGSALQQRYTKLGRGRTLPEVCEALHGHGAAGMHPGSRKRLRAARRAKRRVR